MISLAFESLIRADEQLLLLCNGMHSSFFDQLMYLLSGEFTWIPFYATLAVVLFLTRSVKAAAVLLVALALGVFLIDYPLSHWIRPAIGRLRPTHLDNPLSAMITLVNDYRGGTYGFPSSHAANSFALAVFMSLVARNRWLVGTVMIWALLNSFTRLYLGVHYPSDIVVGAIYGSLVGWCMFSLAFLFMKRFSISYRPLRRVAGHPWRWPLLAAVAVLAGASLYVL